LLHFIFEGKKLSGSQPGPLKAKWLTIHVRNRKLGQIPLEEELFYLFFEKSEPRISHSHLSKGYFDNQVSQIFGIFEFLTTIEK